MERSSLGSGPRKIAKMISKKQLFILFLLVSSWLIYSRTLVEDRTTSPETRVESPAMRLPLPTLQLSGDVANISIIITAQNSFEVTLKCLQSLFDSTKDLRPLEVILIDDGSTDQTRFMEEATVAAPFIRVIHHTEPLGYLRSVNAAVRMARGSKLVILNNDLVLVDGWMEHMLRVFEIHEKVGIVGGKILWPDGRLQEACSMVFEDGRPANYGYGDKDPDQSRYNYVRQAGYCSACFIMVSREAAESVGMYDERFIPAYYEDTDLAVAVARKGYSVLYQPLAVTYHHSGQTLSSSKEALMAQNGIKFREKWADVFKENYPPHISSYLAKDWPVKRRVLFIDFAPQNSMETVRLVEMMRMTRWKLGMHAAFAPLCPHEISPELSRNLSDFGIELLREKGVVGCDLPTLVLEKQRSGCEYHVVVVARSFLAERFVPMVRETCPSARVIFDGVDGFESNGNISNAADLTFATDSFNKGLLEALVPEARVAIAPFVPTFTDNLHGVPPFASRSGVLVVGGNTEDILWFGSQVLPLLPGTTFHILVAGLHVARPILGLVAGHPDITKLHINPDARRLQELYRQTLVLAAPGLEGNSDTSKLIDALHLGLPIVTTGAQMNGGCLVAPRDSPAQFSRHIASLLESEALWTSISLGGQTLASQQFSREALELGLRQALHD